MKGGPRSSKGACACTRLAPPSTSPDSWQGNAVSLSDEKEESCFVRVLKS